MTENEISGDVLDAAVKIHKQFGPGMLESVYETFMLNLHLGLVVNSGLATVKEGFVRIVNGYK